MSSFKVIALVGGLAALPAAVAGQDFESQLKARQGQFNIMAFNLGMLGAMAKGETPFEATAAEAAAGNLVAVSGLAQNHWPEGSDSMSIDGTRAMPAIWEDLEDFQQKWAAFATQAAALADVAPNGVDGLGAAIGALGQPCQSCHESYREPSS